MKCLAVLLAFFVTLPAIGQSVKATAFTTNYGAFVTNIVRQVSTNSLVFNTNQFLMSGADVSIKSGVLLTNVPVYTSVGTLSIDSNARALIASGGLQAVNWNSYLLLSSLGAGSVDWNARQLLDSGANVTLDWDSKTLSSGWGGTGAIFTNLILRGTTDAQGTLSAVNGLLIPTHISSDTVGYQQFLLHRPGDSNILTASMWWYNPTNNTVIGSGSGLTNVQAESVVSAVTNQWLIDATNAALGSVSSASNTTINVNIVNATNITVQSNLTVNGKSTFVQNLYSFDHTITNGVYFYTNAWSGPTNPIDLRLEDQYYDTVTPVSITGFQNKSNTVSQTVVLTIRNLASTNVTCYMAANVRAALFTNSFAIPPTSEAILSMRYSPSGPRTNCILQIFY